jgi:hypothetical protein
MRAIYTNNEGWEVKTVERLGGKEEEHTPLVLGVD